MTLTMANLRGSSCGTYGGAVDCVNRDLWFESPPNLKFSLNVFDY